MQVRLRNLNVVAEDRVEFDLERADAGPPAFPLLDLCQHLFAVAREFAQFVKITIYARRNYAPIGETQRRLWHNRLLNAFAQVAEFVEQAMQSPQSLCRESSHRGLDSWNLRERCSQSQHIPWIRRLQRDAAQKALQVEHAVERTPQLLARDDLFYARFHGIKARIDFCQIERGP